MNSIVDDIFKYVAHISQQACGMHQDVFLEATP